LKTTKKGTPIHLSLTKTYLHAKHFTLAFIQTSMPKLTQWAENNIPEGLSIFGLGLCEFKSHRGRTKHILSAQKFNSNTVGLLVFFI
jgi:hypothetical protein